MILDRLFSRNPRENSSGRRISSQKSEKDLEHSAFLQVSSAIKGQKDISSVLDLIGREAARCLKAHRSTVLLVDAAKGGLKTQYTYSPNHPGEKPGLQEEKEISRRAMAEKRSILLSGPRDFGEFFKSGERDRRINSLLTVPFGIQDKMIGTLNLALLDGRRNFGEKDLQCLGIFANQASIALQNQYLIEEAHRAAALRKNYEQYLDDLMKQLQNLSVEERRRIDEHIGKFLSGVKTEREPRARPVEIRGKTKNHVVRLTGEMSFEDSPEPLTQKVQVEVETPLDEQRIDLSRAGIFIPTANPRDLGEQFPLKLYVAENETLQIACKVIFTNKYGKESENLRRGMEIKFLDLPPEMQTKLEISIREIQNSEDTAAQCRPNGFEEDGGEEIAGASRVAPAEAG